ncbi:hypothetical protein ACTFIZ_001664 [Dictyostelium cf. discoideum]
MDNVDTYQHINCQFIENKIILYCKDCKVLLCNKCIKDHNDHDFDLLPIITDTIKSPIKSIELSKLDLFIKRKPAQSLAELHGLMKKVVEIVSEDNSMAIPFKERENQFGEIEKYLIEMFNYFLQNNQERVNHYFLQCLTGSGIGKTRFVKECWKFLKKKSWDNNKLAETMKNLLYINIDFNGGGDALLFGEVNEGTFEEALSKRLFTRGVFGVSLQNSNLILLEEEKPLFSVKKVLDYIAQLYRDGKNTLSILIHLDEFPMAHIFACSQNHEFYIKKMIELLGNYRCNGSNSPEASISNIFIIPLLTGTTTILQQEIHLSKWLHKSINLTPLCYDSCKDIINNKFKIPKLKGKSTSILEDRLFGIFIKDLGVIPRYLQWLLDLELMKKVEDENIDIPSFIGSLGFELSSTQRMGSMKIMEFDNKFLKTILYLSICRIPVGWNTTICNKTIEFWSYTGNLFLQYDEAVKGMVIFITIFDLFNIAKKLKILVLEQLTRFPLTSYTHGASFEENTAIIITSKINTFIKVNQTSTSKLVDFFPLDNDIIHESAFKEVKICEVSLYQHTSKWFYRSNDKLDITDSQEAILFGSSKTNGNLINIFSNNTKSVNLLCKGNTSIDIRINFKLQNAIGKKYLMVVINTKFSNCDTYLGKEAIDKIFENCINLENYYKDTYILPILLTNFKVNKCHVEDSKGKVIIYHSKNIHLFYGKLWHRVLFDSHKSDFINTPDLSKQLEDISLQN